MNRVVSVLFASSLFVPAVQGQEPKPRAATPVSPAGAGIRYDRIDSDASGWAWRIVVFAIETPKGAAWLMIDGPPEEWAARAEDLERIPPLFRVLP